MRNKQLPLWIQVALAEKGTKEIAGQKHCPRIIEYHATTTLKATTDEVPWCSSFVNWVMENSGIDGTGSAAARSWLKWGMPLAEKKFGCIVVFKRGTKPWQGHVGFFMRSEKDHLWVLGGNQGNEVKVERYPEDDVLGYQWPFGFKNHKES